MPIASHDKSRGSTAARWHGVDHSATWRSTPRTLPRWPRRRWRRFLDRPRDAQARAGTCASDVLRTSPSLRSFRARNDETPAGDAGRRFWSRVAARPMSYGRSTASRVTAIDRELPS